MKYLLTIIILFSFSCNHHRKVVETIDFPAPPSPPPNFIPHTPPPNFIPDITELAEIQINPVPHPFNLNGSIPYVVWVNGKKLKLNHREVRDLASSLNLKFEQPKDTAQIHNGEGWLYPLPLEKLN